MVIQRWQTVLLFVSTILTILCLSLPLNGIYVIAILPMFIVGVLSAIFSAAAIITFKQLDLQKRLALLAAFFALITIVSAALSGLYISFAFLIPAAILDIWAYFRIKADQNLLKSYDRIR